MGTKEQKRIGMIEDQRLLALSMKDYSFKIAENEFLCPEKTDKNKELRYTSTGTCEDVCMDLGCIHILTCNAYKNQKLKETEKANLNKVEAEKI